MAGMKKKLQAAAIGIGAGGLLLGGYIGAWQHGIRIPSDFFLPATAAFTFAATVAVFALIALERPSHPSAKATLHLNEEPATNYIYPFTGPKVVPILARPDMTVGEMLVRQSAALKGAPDKTGLPIALTIRSSNRKPFASITLQQLFLALKPFPLEHVLLMNEKNNFIGYIPGKRALKEFVGDGAVENIDKYIVKVLANPSENAVLREIGGATNDDAISEAKDTQVAEAQIWTNEKTNGLVIHRGLQPIGYISKVDLLRLNVGRL